VEPRLWDICKQFRITDMSVLELRDPAFAGAARQGDASKVNVTSSHAVISLHVAVQEARSLCCAAVTILSTEGTMRH